ncbi:hypothetical protein [Flavobacterium sp.]|uniref:hypothetical protein n=1 Tax=Flavobacterium sp. TaxID=239 RepID=UPI0037506626
MKTIYKVVVLILFFQIGFSQNSLRKIVHGQAVNDSIRVKNVVVFNINTNKGKIVNPDGSFEVLAKAKDTLVFSSLSYKPVKMVLTQKQIDDPILLVLLEVFYSQLNEVVINNKSAHPIGGKSQKIVDKQYVADAKSSPKNQYIYDGTIVNGVNFVRLYKDVLSVLKKKNPKKSSFTSQSNFTEKALQQTNYTFFTKTLNLNDEEIKLFLMYCENDIEANAVLKLKSDFELMDFMIKKNKEFKKLKQS